MRLANIADRSTLVTPNSEIVDISQATGGDSVHRIQECTNAGTNCWISLPRSKARRASPLCKCRSTISAIRRHNRVKVFAIGLNYAAHAAEAALAVPEDLTVFTKFVTDRRAPVQDHATASRRRHLHRHPSRCWGWPRACALSLAGRRTCHVHERRR